MTKKKSAADRNRNDWEKIVSRLTAKRSTRRIKMGSKGSAQVTRIRLLREYDRIFVRTKGDVVELSINPFRL